MKQRTYWQWVRVGLTWQIGILLISVSSLLVYVVFQISVRRLRCEPIQATIIKSNLKPCEDGLFSVDIAFRYTVERIPYNKGKYRDDFVEQCLSEPEAKKILARYPPGQKVDAWYDPKQPKYAVLDRSMGMFDKGLLGFTGGLIVLSLIVILLFIRRRIAKAPPLTNTELTGQD